MRNILNVPERRALSASIRGKPKKNHEVTLLSWSGCFGFNFFGRNAATASVLVSLGSNSSTETTTAATVYISHNPSLQKRQ